MDKAVIEAAHVLGISEDQPVIVTVCDDMVKQRPHFLCICAALFHINFRSFKQFAEKPHLFSS